MSVETSAPARSTNQLVGWIAGLVFIAVGLLGFTVSGGHHAIGTEGGDLVGLFKVNVLHNFVHLLVGALLVIGAMAGARLARTMNGLVGAVYLLVGVVGLFIVNTDANIIALNTYDNILHLVSGVVLLAVAARK